MQIPETEFAEMNARIASLEAQLGELRRQACGGADPARQFQTVHRFAETHPHHLG